MTTPRTTIAAVLVAIVMAMSACGPATRAGAPRATHALPVDTMTVPVETRGVYGGRFVIAVTNGPKTFNPIVIVEASSSDIANRMYSSLTNYDNETQRDIPDIAKSWEMAPDQVTWTYHLRRGAQFSDGHPITSADVLFSFEVTYDDSLHPPVQDLIKMDGQPFDVSAPDSYTVVIRTPRPNAVLLAVVSAVRILPRHRLEPAFRAGRFESEYGVQTAPESLVVSGPFKLKAYAPNERVVLEPNPYWYGVDPWGQRLPYLDELVYLVVPDQDTADLKFRSGEVDGIDNVKPENYAWYAEHQKEGGYTLYTLGPGLNTNFVWFNLNRAPSARGGVRAGDPAVGATHYAWFSNPKFRRAVSQAIDRDAMVTSVMFGAGVKNWSMATAANQVWHTPDVPRWDFDLGAARRGLAELGMQDRDGDGVLEDAHGHAVQFTLKTNADNRMRVGMANFIRDDLAKVGIKVVLAPADFNTFITNVTKDFDYDAGLLGFQGGTPPDPAMSQATWRSSGATHMWHIKQSKPETPEEARIDQLMDVLIGTPDMAPRKQAWVEMQSLMNEPCWIVWLPTLVVQLPVRNRFGNVRPTVIPHRILWNIERVFVKPHA